MNIPHDAAVLRIYISENERHEDQPLFEAVVLKAREAHLAGATVLRGPMGFGKSGGDSVKFARVAMDLPVVIEIVESEEKIHAFLPMIEPMIGCRLVTIERAQVIRFRESGNPDGSEPG